VALVNLGRTVGTFDPSNGPEFASIKKSSSKQPLNAGDSRSVGLVVGALGGDISDAAVVKFGVEHAREAGEDRHQATRRTTEASPRGWWKRLRRSQ
jgi:hypothetical protein